MRLLIVEDEPRMADLLAKGLYENGYVVITAADGEAGLAIALAYELDAVVLDIGLPKRDGFDLLRELRTMKPAIPVLVLTARDTEDEIIRGLDLGADDYLTKPFSFAELVLRIQAITRATKSDCEVIEAGELQVDPVRHKAARCGTDLDLSKLEFQLLLCLAQHAGNCVTRARIVSTLWGNEGAVSHGALDVLVNSLRAKLDAPFASPLLHTVRGAGYLLSLSNTAGGDSP